LFPSQKSVDKNR